MQFLQEADVYATPVGDLISVHKNKRISTWWGVFCSIVFYALMIVAFGFLVAGMSGADSYFS